MGHLADDRATVSTSRSPKATSLDASKYSSPMLRPPKIAAWLSATKALLCIRRLTREKSVSMPSPRKLRERPIEQPDLDVGVGIDAKQDFVIGLRTNVVEQHTHPHPAVRRAQQSVGEKAPAQVVVPDVVLDIQRTLRRIGQDDACQQGIDAASQRAKATLARVRLQCGVKLLSQWRRCRVLQGMRLSARNIAGQARTAI